MVWSDLLIGIVVGTAMTAFWSQSAAAQAAPAVAAAQPGEGMLDDPCSSPQSSGNWAALCRFGPDNARIARGARPKVVFMGDSITANWGDTDPALFADGIVDRGIGGQTSAQILLRFYQDVVALHPRIVHIMAGTNDIAGNAGPTSPDQYKNNIKAMVTLAQANHIGVILASIPPSARFAWRPAILPAPRILELNAWLKAYAAAVGATYADYYAVLAGADGRIQDRYSKDGVHPDALGYQVMRPVAEAAIAQALRAAQKVGLGQ